LHLTGRSGGQVACWAHSTSETAQDTPVPRGQVTRSSRHRVITSRGNVLQSSRHVPSGQRNWSAGQVTTDGHSSTDGAQSPLGQRTKSRGHASIRGLTHMSDAGAQRPSAQRTGKPTGHLNSVGQSKTWRRQEPSEQRTDRNEGHSSTTPVARQSALVVTHSAPHRMGCDKGQVIAVGQ
jgi:hypothetical protein